MKAFVRIVSVLLLAFTAMGCHSKEEDAEAKVQANKERIVKILRATGRPGIESVISHLDSTDFYTMPAGGHHTEVGGLAQHSLEVYRLMRILAPFQRSSSIAITALLHDMGKIDTGGWHPWRSVKHLHEWGLQLTDKEYVSIFYHHKRGLRYYRYALRRALTLSDIISAGWWKLWHSTE